MDTAEVTAQDGRNVTVEPTVHTQRLTNGPALYDRAFPECRFEFNNNVSEKMCISQAHKIGV